MDFEKIVSAERFKFDFKDRKEEFFTKEQKNNFSGIKEQCYYNAEKCIPLYCSMLGELVEEIFVRDGCISKKVYTLLSWQFSMLAEIASIENVDGRKVIAAFYATCKCFYRKDSALLAEFVRYFYRFNRYTHESHELVKSALENFFASIGYSEEEYI